MPSAKRTLIGCVLVTLLCLQVTQSRMIPFKDRGKNYAKHRKSKSKIPAKFKIKIKTEFKINN